MKIKRTPHYHLYFLMILLLACEKEKQEEETFQKLRVVDYFTLKPIARARVDFTECSKPDFTFGCMGYRTFQTLYTVAEGIIQYEPNSRIDNMVVSKANYMTDEGRLMRCNMPAPANYNPHQMMQEIFLLPTSKLEFKFKGDTANDSTGWVVIDAYYNANSGCDFSYLFGGTPHKWGGSLPHDLFMVKNDTVVYRTGVGNMDLHLEIRYYKLTDSIPWLLTHSKILQSTYTPRDERTTIDIAF